MPNLEIARCTLTIEPAPTLHRYGWVVRMTVSAYMSYWLDTSARHRVRPTTLESYEQKVRLYIIVPILGAVPIQRLTSARVQAFYGGLLRGERAVSPRTVRYVHAILHRALMEAVSLGIVSRNVTDAVAPPRAPRPRIKSWDAAEAQRFLAVAASDHYHPLWLVALHTGMRRGELLGLRWADVDLEGAVLHVRQAIVSVAYRPRVAELKTASGRRTIALDDVCVSALREHRARQAERRLACGASWQDHDLVFASTVGTPLDGNSISRRFVKLAAAAGVPRIPFHGLRHTRATLLMKAGVHPKVASERLGHASIMLTLQTYSHVLPQMQQEAAALFAAVVGQGEGVAGNA